MDLSDRNCHVWLATPHVRICTTVPLPGVPLPAGATQTPLPESVPLAVNENFWALLLLHDHDCTVLPFVKAPPFTSTHRPGAPVIVSWCGGTAITVGPVGVGVAVGLGGALVVGAGGVVVGSSVAVVTVAVGVPTREDDVDGLGDALSDGDGESVGISSTGAESIVDIGLAT